MFAWTDEWKDRLRARRAAGRSASEIAEEFGQGLTRSAIIGACARHDIPFPARARPVAPPRPKVSRPARSAPKPKSPVAPRPAPAPRAAAPARSPAKPSADPLRRPMRAAAFRSQIRDRAEDLRLAEMARAAIRDGAVEITRCPPGPSFGFTSYDDLLIRSRGR